MGLVVSRSIGCAHLRTSTPRASDSPDHAAGAPRLGLCSEVFANVLNGVYVIAVRPDQLHLLLLFVYAVFQLIRWLMPVEES